MDRKRKVLLVVFIGASLFSMVARYQYQKYEQRKRERLLDSLATYRQRQFASEPAPTPTPEDVIDERRAMFDSTLPEESFDLIKQSIGQEFKLMELFISESEVRANVSTDSQTVQAYEREKNRKTVSGPESVRIIGGEEGKLGDSLFKQSEINFALIPKLAKEALERAQLPDAKVENIRFSYPLIRYAKESPEWTVLVERGEGANIEWKHVMFHANGKFKDIF